MFNPNEWTRKIQFILEAPRITYINNHTGLPKILYTFTSEQQTQLEELHSVKVYEWAKIEYRRDE